MIIPATEFDMTNCPSEDLLLDYAAGHLDPAQAAQFERHADSCARCAELRASQSAVWLTLDEWQPAPVSENFNRELWRRIDADEAARRHGWGETIKSAFWKRIAPLGLAAAVLTGVLVVNHSDRPTAKAPSMVVTATDADQLERTLDDIQLLHEVDATTATPEKVM
jgi:anti-sigma factor RsiW